MRNAKFNGSYIYSECSFYTHGKKMYSIDKKNEKSDFQKIWKIQVRKYSKDI